MSSLDELLSSAIAASLSPFLDEDICEYIQSTLAEDPEDEDARENVEELLRGSIDDGTDPETVIADFFEKLKLSTGGNDSGDSGNKEKKNDEIEPLQKLTKAVTIKEHDIKTFASGLSAEPMNDHEDEQISSIAAFYANMIDISNNEAVTSERHRRKERQKAIRLEMEEAERKRAIQEAMDLFNDDSANDDNPEDLLDAAVDNSADVHIKNMDLPNLRGGGPDLLQNASLTLARGRRYGLMGRNGCGKTTFMTYLAQRQIEGAVPKKMTMLLVRQEIVGSDMSAVDTVLKSDVKREGVKRFIQYCESEIERLERGGEKEEKEDSPAISEETKTEGGEDPTANGKKVKGSSKGRQKLLEKKKARLEKAARAKAKQSQVAVKIRKVNVEDQKNKLTEKLGKAYQQLAEIEEEFGDPLPRARKVLNGMGFSEEMQDKPTSQLSGGWRMRVSISCALFASPSLLL
jgi:ABC-type dipeptide/oligopeptide/nickel transport system ATPase subunit